MRVFGEVVVFVDHRAAAHLLERIAPNVAGREGMREIMRLVAAHGRHMLGSKHPAIDRAPRDWVFWLAEELLAEALLAAVVEAQVDARAVLHHEADQTAEVITVGVAEYQPSIFAGSMSSRSALRRMISGV